MKERIDAQKNKLCYEKQNRYTKNNNIFSIFFHRVGETKKLSLCAFI